ncbi:MAG: phosphoribosylaminoimidazolesuccinocarboxamide synthase [Desulfovibrio sp.]|nr:phosphoribosylaminoimidazolesuccinocarboxamide synthase [Desulfovibrio sp.]
MDAVIQTNIPEYRLLHRGKVRDIYEISPEALLLVTTDRISAYDVVMEQPIPHKGAVLNQITLFWMEMMAPLVKNHLLATDVRDMPAPLHKHAAQLQGRSVLVRKCSPLPVECIVRGYITGSGWNDYRNTGAVCGHALPAGLLESQELPQPLFTPSTKADLGAHDENITVEQARTIAGAARMAQAESMALAIYNKGRDYARSRGIIIADTKFEFGVLGDELLLIDEVLTPDSSRFWPADSYQPGHGQPSFDKQFLRDWLSAQPWNKEPPPPALPQEIIDQTRAKYLEAFERLTGKALPGV